MVMIPLSTLSIRQVLQYQEQKQSIHRIWQMQKKWE